jgi:predicted Zn-dependent protease
MANEKRLAMLEELTRKGEADSFTWYALANEYASFGRVQEALTSFKTLRAQDPDYVPQYLICGTMLVRAGRPGEGREWIESGIIKARAKGDSHAQRELEEALEQVPPPPSIA